MCSLEKILSESTELKKGGGTRRFFRNDFEGVPAVFCFYDTEKEENAYYAGIARFLKKIGVPVPAVLLDFPEKKLFVMEDLGDTDLWTLQRENSADFLPAYRSALCGLACLHTQGIKNLPPDFPMMRDGFNRAYYQWERDYFLKNAVENGLKIPLSASEKTALEEELSALAETLLALPPQLVHRDCQSQNILWKDGNAVFIDFQGIRVGTGWYDVASLLFDPYTEISPEARKSLLQFYCKKIGVPADRAAEENLFRAAAQRLMQALGAYFFLSGKMGKPHFRQHAFPALKNLVAVTAGTLPLLHGLAAQMLAREKSLMPNS